MNRAVAAFILAATLLLPAAKAAPAEGLFSIQGDIRLPEGAYLRSEPLGIFLGGTGQSDPPLDFTGFLLQAEELGLTIYETKNTAASLPTHDHPATAPYPIDGKDQTVRTLSNATITVQGRLEKGYVALENASASSAASLLSTASALLTSVARTEFADANATVGGESVDANPTYYRVLSTPHALSTAPGHLSFDGSAKLKLYGMTLRVVADDGPHTIRTGGWYETQDVQGVPQAGVYVQRWVVLTGEGIRFQASSTQEWRLAGGATALDWQGEATFRATSGTLETPDAVYGISQDASRPTSLDGTFQATLGTRGSGAVTSELRVVGELAQTNLPVAQSKSILSTPSGSSVLLWLGLAVGVAVGAGTFVHWRRHGAARAPVAPPVEELPLSPALAAEYYVGLAEQALQFDDHAKALHWISLAREASPTSSDVATTMAYVLGELGQYDEALAAYEEASRLDPWDGEADLNASRLAAQAGKPPEVVETLVVRALERTPEFVFDVEEDLEFRPLAMRPAFREALARAWDRWGGDQHSVPP